MAVPHCQPQKVAEGCSARHCRRRPVIRRSMELLLHQCDEAIATPTGRRDIPWRRRLVLQGAACRPNAATQSIIRDKLVWPQAQKLVAGDDAGRDAPEIGEDIEDLRSQRDELPSAAVRSAGYRDYSRQTHSASSRPLPVSGVLFLPVAPLGRDIIPDAYSWCPAGGESHVGKISASCRQSIGVLSSHAPWYAVCSKQWVVR